MPWLVFLVWQSANLPHQAVAARADLHEIAQLDGARIGVLRTAVAPEGKDGKLLRTTATLDLSLRRYGAAVRLRREEVTVETADGKVLGIGMRQGAPGGRQLTLIGTLDSTSGAMRVKIDDRAERRVPWSDEVLGLWRQQEYFAKRKPKPGEKFGFYRYEPTYNAVLTVRGAITGRETVEVLGAKRSLWRAELTPDRLEAGATSVQPPKSVWWLDDAFVPVRRQVEIEGLGTVLFTRASKELAGAAPPSAVDVGARSLVALDRAIPRPYDTRSALYHVTLQGDDDAESAFVSDAHQEVRELRGRSFELLVHPVRPGTKGNAQPAAEYLASCHFIDHDDPRIKELARRAVGEERDAWKKALRIERFVKGLMSNDNTAPLVPASQIARSPRGDCRHHAFLTAALCRAEGLPSRTAIGLLYVTRGGPKLGFHTWAEVLIDGQWLGVDSTLGKGGVSAAHVKVTDHSWHETASLTPLLPVSRVLGKLRVKVLRADP
jgi:transglutaminase-like putative cysteine protease